MAALHDGADQETGLAAARAALQNTRSSDNAEGLADRAAMRADKAVRPAGALKIGSARRVIGKLPLELRERLWKSQIVTLMDVHGGHDGQVLDLVGVCINRIGTDQTTPHPRPPKWSRCVGIGARDGSEWMVAIIGMRKQSRAKNRTVTIFNLFMPNT